MMTQDEISPQDIIEMARQAGIESNEYDTYSELSLKAFVCVDYELEAFAKLVAAKEREACAQLCDDPSKYGPEGEWCAAAIRERCKND